MLSSRICELFQIEVPIVLAGMGEASVPSLVAAVSNAGGLGVLGAATCGPKRLRAWIGEVRDLTDSPFGVDTLLPASVLRFSSTESSKASSVSHLKECQRFAAKFLESEGLERPSRTVLNDPDEPELFSREFFEAQMEIVIEERVPVYVSGLGNPAPYIKKLHANGTKVMCVVGAVRHALKVKEIGIDAIVAQGHEGGGHNSSIGSLALIPQVKDVVGDIPVLGAGGITDGRGLAAALMLGAEGAWVGTAFLATEEAGIARFKKDALVAGSDESTVVTASITGKPARMIQNKWSSAWELSGLKALPMPFQSMVSGPVLSSASAAKRSDVDPGFAGQGLGMVHAVRPADEVMRTMVMQAEEVLKGARRFLKYS